MTNDASEKRPSNSWWKSPYDEWLVRQDVPVVSGYYVEDIRTLELGHWSLRGCPGAVLNLVSHAGVTEARVVEVPPGESIPPFRMAVEEAVYVAEGHGHRDDLGERAPQGDVRVPEEQPFPRTGNYYYEFTNARGDQRVRTLHVSYLPMAMGIHRNEDYFFKSDFVDPSDLYSTEGNPFAAEAYAVEELNDRGGIISKSTNW